MNSTAYESNGFATGNKKGKRRFSTAAFEEQLNTDRKRASLKSQSAMGNYQKVGRGNYDAINPLNYQGGGYSSRNDFGATNRMQGSTSESFAAYSRQTLDAIQPGLAVRVDRMQDKISDLANSRQVPLFGNTLNEMPQTDRTLTNTHYKNILPSLNQDQVKLLNCEKRLTQLRD